MDKEKRANAIKNRKDAKPDVKSSSFKSSLPVPDKSSSGSKKPRSSSSSVQNLAEAINNARKEHKKLKEVPIKSPTRKPAKGSVGTVGNSPQQPAASRSQSSGAFSEFQVKKLIEEFTMKNNISKEEAKILALEVGLKEDQIRRWFANRRNRSIRSSIPPMPVKQGKVDKNSKSHKLKSLEVSVLMPMSDIMSLSLKESPEVVDILDDSLDSDDEEVSLLEVSKVVTPAAAPAPKEQGPKAGLAETSSAMPSHEKIPVKVKTVESGPPKLKNSQNKAGKPQKVGSSVKKKESKKKEVVKVKTIDPNMLEGKPCTKQEELVEELLKSIERLEEDLKNQDADLYNTKKDLEAVQATLEGKERVLKTVQESIPKVVRDHKNAIQAKDEEIAALKLSTSKLKNELEAKEKVFMTEDTESRKQLSDHDQLSKDNEIIKLKAINSKLKDENEAIEKVSQKKDIDIRVLNEEVKQVKGDNEKLKEAKNAIEVELSDKLKVLGDEFKLEKAKFKKAMDEKKVDLEESQLKKHEEECKQMKEVISECEEKIALLESDIGKKDDEVKILKYKERQASSNQVTVDETKKLLEENRKDTLALKDYERKLTRKVTSLEFDLYTKTAESETQALVISRLNEKIQSLQQSRQELPKVDKDAVKIDDTSSEDDNCIMKGVPQTSPYVVNSSKKKRKRTISHSDSDDELNNKQDAPEVPEFESLCEEIESLCVPSNRPLPIFSTSGHHKKIKILDADHNPAGDEAYDIATFVLEKVLENII